MLRFLSFLFNKPYETCKSCETLKEQLRFERAEKHQLTETLLNIIQPKVIVPEKETVELKPLEYSVGLFSRRRAILEDQARQRASILKERKNVGIPDGGKEEFNKTVEKLEEELNIHSESENAS